MPDNRAKYFDPPLGYTYDEEWNAGSPWSRPTDAIIVDTDGTYDLVLVNSGAAKTYTLLAGLQYTMKVLTVDNEAGGVIGLWLDPE